MKRINGKEAYPLTAAQKLHFYYQKYCPKKQVLNIGTSLTIQQSLDFDALKQAVYQAYDRCETMRLRFTEDTEGNVWQYLAEREERDIEFFDFTGWEGWAAEMREWTSVPFVRYDSPLNRVVMIITPDGFQGIYLLVDHMTMDAQSLILFLKDVIEIYCNMKYEGIEYPKEMSSYLKQLEKDLAYEAKSKAQKKDIAFFENLISSSEPIFNSAFGPMKLEAERISTGNPKLRAVTNTSTNVEADIALFELEAEPSYFHGVFIDDGIADLFSEREWKRGCVHYNDGSAKSYSGGEEERRNKDSLFSVPDDCERNRYLFRRAENYPGWTEPDFPSREL